MSAIPRDQAAELRLLMEAHGRAPKAHVAKSQKRSARVIAVASGKGGVGKTSIAVNLAVRLSQTGHRVVLVDADLGTANADLLLGVRAQHDLSALLKGRWGVDDILTPISSGLQLIAGASGLTSIADIDTPQRHHLLTELARLEDRYDIIVIDCGAGISQNVLGFARAADDLLLITTPEPTAITDAYALVKVLGRSGGLPKIGIVMNQAESEREGRTTGDRLVSVASRFLKIDVSIIGLIVRDEYVRRAIRLRSPLVQRFPRSPASAAISALADRFARPVAGSPSEAGFFERVLRFFH